MSERIEIELVGGPTLTITMTGWSSPHYQYLRTHPIKAVRVVDEVRTERVTPCVMGERRTREWDNRHRERRSARTDVFPVVERRAVRHILGARWGFYERRTKDRRKAK